MHRLIIITTFVKQFQTESCILHLLTNTVIALVFLKNKINKTNQNKYLANERLQPWGSDAMLSVSCKVTLHSTVSY